MEANLSELAKYQISNFFMKNAPATQQQCDLEAEKITGTSVHTTSLQGESSYTVVSGDETCVVQFRAGDSALDMDFVGCIEQGYDGFAPRHQFVGNLGQLHVYKMNNVGGVSMYLARDKLNENDFSLLKYTVKDFARYVNTNVRYTPRERKCAIQVFRLRVEQNAQADAMSESHVAAQRVHIGALPAPDRAARALSPDAGLSHLDAPESIC